MPISRGISSSGESLAYRGYYINMDRSRDRRDAMDAQLTRLGLAQRYERFAAVDGRPTGATSAVLTDGEIGCFASHHGLLHRHRECDSVLHVLEDDALLASCTADLVEQIIASGMLDRYDLLFTDMAVPAELRTIQDGRARYQQSITRADDGTAVQVSLSTVPYFCCMSSYLVNGRSLPRLCDLLGLELMAGPRTPVDVFIRDKVADGTLRAACVFPFITSIQPGRFASTLTRADRDERSDFAVDLLRHAFFVECDMAATVGLAGQFLPPLHAHSRDRLFGRVLAFVSSPDFRPP